MCNVCVWWWNHRRRKVKNFSIHGWRFFLFNNFFSDERFFYFVNPKHTHTNTCENTLKKNEGKKNEANFVSLCVFVCCCFLLIKNDVVQQKKWNEVKWDAKNINSTCQLSLFALFFFKKLDNNKLFVCSFFCGLISKVLPRPAWNDDHNNNKN